MPSPFIPPNTHTFKGAGCSYIALAGMEDQVREEVIFPSAKRQKGSMSRETSSSNTLLHRVVQTCSEAEGT